MNSHVLVAVKMQSGAEYLLDVPALVDPDVYAGRVRELSELDPESWLDLLPEMSAGYTRLSKVKAGAIVLVSVIEDVRR